MSKTVFHLLAATCLGFLAGCSDRPDDTDARQSSIGERTVAVCFNAAGEVRDVVEITPDMEKIEFIAPEGGSSISVRVLGENVHPSIPKGLKVSSMVGEGLSGKVTVEVKDGVIVFVQGNFLTGLFLRWVAEIVRS